MDWGFRYTPSYTRVPALVVQGMPVGGAIRVTCSGRGCPFAKRTMPVTQPKSMPLDEDASMSEPVTRTMDLPRSVRTRHLRLGARLTIALIRTDWIGKIYIFTVRAGRPPRIQIGCLAPGGTRLASAAESSAWELDSRPTTHCSGKADGRGSRP